MNMFNGLRVIKSVYLTEPGVGWVQCGGGWKVKRTVQVPMRGGIRTGPNTIVMHPATLQALRQSVPRETTGETSHE